MSYQQLTNDERYQIKACLQLHMNQISIAKLLNRSPATISREIRRNTGKRGYRPKQANDQATARRLGAKKHVKLTEALKAYIVQLIKPGQ